jgi:hypothetical protein
MTPERQVSETRMAQSVQGGDERQPEDIAEMVVQAVREEHFLILPDEFHAELIRRRAQDIDAFVRARLTESP